MHLAGVAGVGVDQDELSDVVQQGRYEELVAVVVANLLREPLGGALGGYGVKAEALGLTYEEYTLEILERGRYLSRADAERIAKIKDKRDI